MPQVGPNKLKLNLGLRRLWIKTIDGATQRQSHRALHADWAAPGGVSGWNSEFRFTEDRIEEKYSRRFRRGQWLAGYTLADWGLSSLEISGGATASSHRAGRLQDDDLGAAARVSAEKKWSIGSDINGRARVARFIDWRSKVPSSHARLFAENGWRYSDNDSVVASLQSDWSNTDFYPNLDDFSTRARQRHQARSVSARWEHEANGNASAWSGLYRQWSVTIDAGISRDRYSVRAGDPESTRLPSDYELATEGYSLEWVPALGPGSVRFVYRYRNQDEEFGVRARNQKREAGEFDAITGWRVTDVDSLFGRAFFRVESFNTPPDSGFFDDRDLATRIIELGWQRRFHASFVMTGRFSFRGFHQVFIAPGLSGSNNTSDVYYFSPSMEWKPLPQVAVSTSLAIRAHYRFFDFRRDDPDGPGTLFRSAESTTRITMQHGQNSRPPSSRLAATVSYVYRYEDFGPLIWEENWLQRVDWDRRIHILSLETGIPLTSWARLTPNGTWEIKQPYNHERRNDNSIAREADDRFRRWTAGFDLAVHTATGTTALISYRRREQRTTGRVTDATDKIEFILERTL